LVRYKLLFIILFNCSLIAQNHPDSRIDSLLRTGIDKIILQDYAGASETFNHLVKIYPQNPLGNIYLTATIIAESVDFQEQINEHKIDSLIELSSNLTDRLLYKDDENLWYNYYRGLIYGYQAYYDAIIGNFISAFADGVTSLHSFQKCLEIDSLFYEAYIALGSYNYWKSAQTKSLLWLPFVSDKREEGIEFLEKALKADSYNKYLAAYSLLWIYIDYEESEKAAKVAEEMLTEHPNSRFFKWGLARAYQDIDKIKSIEIYNEILKSFETITSRNQFNDVVLLHKIAMLNAEVGNRIKALQLCNQILDFKFNSAKIKERLKDRMTRVLKLKESLEKE